MKGRVAAVLLVAVLLAAAGCAPSQGRAVEGGTLRLGMFSAPRGVFNPLLGENAGDQQVMGLVFSALLSLDAHLKWECDLCQVYTVSPDNRTVTFSLRPDVRWHDGQPLTAEDVAFTFRSVLHPEYTGKLTRGLAALAGVERMLDRRDRLVRQAQAGEITAEQLAGRKAADWKAWLEGPGRQAIEVVDPLTIRFTTNAPYGPLLTTLATPIIPAHIYRKVPIARWAGDAAAHRPVGTGPYKFVTYTANQSVELERYDGFHRGRPFVSKIVLKVTSGSHAPGQLVAGELDHATVTPADLETVHKAGKQVQVSEHPGFGYQYLGLNHDSPLFADRRVRQALMYGINRQAMVDVLLKGHGTVINTHMLPSLWAYEGAVLNAYPYDPARAVELLAAAGWSEVDRNGWRTRGGRRFAFTLKYPVGNKVREASAALIQADLKRLGIQVLLQKMDLVELISDVFGQRGAEAWLLGWRLGVEPDPGPIFRPDNKWGRATGWSSARSDELLRQGRRLLQPDERKPVYAEWARLVNEELPVVFLYAGTALEAVRTDRVRGWKPDARGATWNIWEWWMPKSVQNR